MVRKGIEGVCSRFGRPKFGIDQNHHFPAPLWANDTNPNPQKSRDKMLSWSEISKEVCYIEFWDPINQTIYQGFWGLSSHICVHPSGNNYSQREKNRISWNLMVCIYLPEQAGSNGPLASDEKCHCVNHYKVLASTILPNVKSNSGEQVSLMSACLPQKLKNKYSKWDVQL